MVAVSQTGIAAFDPAATWDDVCDAYRRCGLPIVSWHNLTPAYQAAWKIFIANLELRVARDVAAFKSAVDASAYQSGWNKDQLRRQLESEVRRQVVDISPELNKLRAEVQEAVADRQRTQGELGAAIKGWRKTERELDAVKVQLAEQNAELKKLRVPGRPYRPTAGYARVGPPVRHVYFLNADAIFRKNDCEEMPLAVENDEQRWALAGAFNAADEAIQETPKTAIRYYRKGHRR